MGYRPSAVRARLVALSCVSVAVAGLCALNSGHADPPPARRSLDECLARAERNYAGLDAARHKISASGAQLREAWVAPFLNFNVTGFLSFAPQARGNPTFSPDAFGQNPFAGNYGYLGRATVETGVPISPWTWLRLANVRDAARMGVQASEGELARARIELRTNVRKAYYGVLFARDALYLLQQATDRLDEVRRQVLEGLDGGTGTYTQNDLLRIRLYAGQLSARQGQALQAEHVALAALRMLTGSPEIDVLDQPSCPVGPAMLPLTHYLTAARLERPEVAMLRAGVSARRLAVSIQRGAYLPDLAVGLSAAYSSSSSIAEQSNPFAANNANFAYWGAGLVLRWNFDPLANHQRVVRLEEELAMTEAQERQALGAIGLEVETAYETAREAENRVTSYAETESAAYALFTTAFQEYQSGVGDSNAALDPLREYLTQRYNHLQAIFDYDSARAALAQVSGTDALAGRSECAEPVAAGEDAGATTTAETQDNQDEINALLRATGDGLDAAVGGDAASDAAGDRAATDALPRRH